MNNKYDWNDIKFKLYENVARDGPFGNVRDVSDFTGIPISTIRTALSDGRLSYNSLVGPNIPQPLSLTISSDDKFNNSDATRGSQTKIMFITDLHVGYMSDGLNLTPTHSRDFIQGLMRIAVDVDPSMVVWGGDILDLPDLSSYVNKSGVDGNMQVALIEAALILSKFSLVASRQIYLEGNHEARLYRRLTKTFPQIKDLKKTGSRYPAASVPHLLGLDDIGVKWYGGWPDNRFIVGNNIVFEHGDIVRDIAGKTAASYIQNMTHSLFFGHTHRTEIARRKLPITDKIIWSGSPGCACIVGRVPGSKRSTDWQIGAFLITLDDDGDVAGVELITRHKKGGCFFRGSRYIGFDYVTELFDLLPSNLK